MTWVTKRQIKVNRAATAWLIRRFLHPEAKRAAFLYDALYAALQAGIAQESRS
jgi:hypothetical protein